MLGQSDGVLLLLILGDVGQRILPKPARRASVRPARKARMPPMASIANAASAAELVGGGMTEANVHQIASRFQRRFKELLAGGDARGGR